MTKNSDSKGLLNEKYYLNRELSWLEFNRRCLAEAEDPTNPLLERVKFLAICYGNMDEFFMIRVAGVRRKVVAGIADIGTDGRTPVQVHRRIHELTQEMLSRQADLGTRTENLRCASESETQGHPSE